MSSNSSLKPSGTHVSFVQKSHNDTYPAIDPKQHDLSGKTVLITGASKGIGRAAAISYARAGTSNIIICARSSLDDVVSEVLAAAKDAGRAEPNVMPLKLDVSSRSNVEAAAQSVKAQFSAIDVLINNAGYLEPWERVEVSDPSVWWTTWEINVNGVYLMCRSFLPLVLASSSKIIINVTSMGAHRTAVGASAYQTSKLAVCRFTEFLMSENGEQGLLALAAHPGSVQTELARGMPEYMMAILTNTPELAGDTFVTWTQKRPEWLAGRFVSVNWDLTELEARAEEIVKGDLLKVRLDVGGT